jgi:CcmD family protein
MMGPWGFVSLAYGIVWGVILVYLYSLKRRYNRAAAELDELESTEASAGNAKK